MFTRLFVQNPIFTNVIAIIAVILGIVSLTRLPIALYPDITPPTIAVSASYPGADAETVAKTVGAPIELQVNGVENMIYFSSHRMRGSAPLHTIQRHRIRKGSTCHRI